MSDDLEDRVHDLERQMARLAGDVLLANSLAALADRDTAAIRRELRGQPAGVDTLRETQPEHELSLATSPGETTDPADSASGDDGSRAPTGRVRTTLYLDAADASALDAAAGRVVAALRGRILRHQALGALIHTGIDHESAAVESLRAVLIQDLQG